MRAKLGTVGAVIALLGASVSPAGTLDISWGGNPSAAEAPRMRYRILIGTGAGDYTRTIETKATRATIQGLADETLHYVRIESLPLKADRRTPDGQEVLAISDELVTLPRPEIDRVDPLFPTGDGEHYTLTVHGRNLSPEAVVRLAIPSLAVESVEPAGAGALSVRVRHHAVLGATGIPPVFADQVLVINPGRKAQSFHESRPLRADVDGDGVVDTRDIDALRAAMSGSWSQNDSQRAADLNGDGRVDGSDLGVLGARLNAAAR